MKQSMFVQSNLVHIILDYCIAENFVAQYLCLVRGRPRISQPCSIDIDIDHNRKLTTHKNTTIRQTTQKIICYTIDDLYQATWLLEVAVSVYTYCVYDMGLYLRLGAVVLADTLSKKIIWYDFIAYVYIIKAFSLIWVIQSNLTSLQHMHNSLAMCLLVDSSL